jgi:hypothetical protein
VGDCYAARGSRVVNWTGNARHGSGLPGSAMTTTTDRIFFIWVSAHYPTVDHAVTDEEMAARNTECRGEYHAVCGAAFLPARDDRPPAPCCPACVRLVRARATLPEVERPLGHPTEHRARHARASWWARPWPGGQR